MLKQPLIVGEGIEQSLKDNVPCFRCLYDRAVSQYLCHPEICEMLEHWLLETTTGKVFRWSDHEAQWTINLALKVIREGEPEDLPDG